MRLVSVCGTHFLRALWRGFAGMFEPAVMTGFFLLALSGLRAPGSPLAYFLTCFALVVFPGGKDRRSGLILTIPLCTEQTSMEELSATLDYLLGIPR